MKNINSVEKAINDLKQGRFVILFDHESRENEGDLIIAADKVTPEAINFMATHGRGLICLAMQETDLERLEIPMMTNTQKRIRTAFANSIEAAHGVTTGISAKDRAHTIKTAINPKSTPADIVMPGHIFPLRAKSGGVLERIGHTEGGVDLAKLAGFTPAAVICEIMNEDGSMARLDDLKKIAQKYDLTLLSIRDLVSYRMKNECVVKEIASSRLPLHDHGNFDIKIFSSHFDQQHHVALIKGKIDPNQPVLVRIHSECFTGDLFGSMRCDCGWQLETALDQVSKDNGIILYLRQEGRGIGLVNKLKAYNLQDEGMDTVEANIKLGFGMDQRDYWIGAQILRYFGVKSVRLLTNNPKKMEDLKFYDIDVVERIALEMPPCAENKNYLLTKKNKLGHLLDFIHED